MAASAPARNSRELNRIQGLCRASWEAGGAFQGGAFQGGDWGNFMSRDWAFYSTGWGQGSAV